jgi:hypothetical protein
MNRAWSSHPFCSRNPRDQSHGPPRRSRTTHSATADSSHRPSHSLRSLCTDPRPLGERAPGMLRRRCHRRDQPGAHSGYVRRSRSRRSSCSHSSAAERAETTSYTTGRGIASHRFDGVSEIVQPSPNSSRNASSSTSSGSGSSHGPEIQPPRSYRMSWTGRRSSCRRGHPHRQRCCLASPGGQCDGELVADREEVLTGTVERADGTELRTGTLGRADREGLLQDTAERAAGSDAAGDAEGAAVACCCGEAAGIAADVPAGEVGVMSAAVPWLSAVPWPDTTSAVATAATMSRRAAAQPASAVRKLVSSSRELMASRSPARPAGRA